MPQKRTIPRVCDQCAAPFLVTAYAAKKRPALYCGTACANLAKTSSLADRFSSKVLKDERAGACWGWTDRLAPNGYARIGKGGKRGEMLYAHAVAWWIATRHWPTDDERVCHTCDNRSCTRNDDAGTYEVAGITYERHGHLWLGTMAANTADMIEKGRNVARTMPERIPRGNRHIFVQHPERHARGEASGSAVLTEALVIEMRRAYAAGGVSMADVAARFGVARSTGALAISRRTWKHIE